MSSYRIVEFAATDMPDAYENLVFSKWLRSLRFGNEFFKLIEPEAYYRAYSKYLFNVLENPETRLRFAVLSDDNDVVLGFSVFNGTVLYYVHVHADNRRLGIGKQLVPKDIDTITHLTKTGMTIWASKYPQWKFNPFL
jgi:GNAT superfamily N-acetyltransferase